MGNHISKVDNSKKDIRIYRSKGTTLSEQGDTTKATVRVKAKKLKKLKKMNTWDKAILNRCHLIQFKRVLPNPDSSKKDDPMDILNWMMDNPDRVHNIQNLDVVDGVNLEELLEEKYFKC